MAKDALSATRPAAAIEERGRRLLRFWWTTWVLMAIVGVADRVLTADMEEASGLRAYLDKLVSYAATMVLYDVLALVGAVAAILAVRLLTGAHEACLSAGGPIGFVPGRAGSPRPRRSGWSSGY